MINVTCREIELEIAPRRRGRVSRERSRAEVIDSAMAENSAWDATVRMLYLAHMLVEAWLGAIKLARGGYAGLDTRLSLPIGLGLVAESTAKYARHHGVALLSIALLGGLVWWRRLEGTETGTVVSASLAFFHSGAVAVMAHALSAKVVLLHLPFAALFACHAAIGGGAPRRPPARP